MSLADTLSAGLNNPECAFFVGAFMGQFTTTKYVLMLLVVFLIFMTINKLAISPFLDFVSNKIYKNKSNIKRKSK